MSLELDVYRRWYSLFSVCGELWINSIRAMYTLEPARETPVHPGHPCIPAGRYKVVLTHSPHLGYICPELLDVPGRTAIRVHMGNFPRDVEGCTAVGLNHEPDIVAESALAFKSLMVMLTKASEIWITYHDGPPFQEEEKEAKGSVQSEAMSADIASPGGENALP